MQSHGSDRLLLRDASTQNYGSRPDGVILESVLTAMSPLAERIASAVHHNFPHPYCFACLAAQQAVKEHDVRAAALVLLVHAGLTLSRRRCFSCRRTGEVLAAKKAA